MLLRLLLVVVLAACLAAPSSAQSTYGGIGALLSRFKAQNRNQAGTPAAGVAYYLIDDLRTGLNGMERVASYHVVLNPHSKLSSLQLKRLVTARELPADAKQVKGWQHPLGGSGYCAVYKSRWLGRVFYGPYVIAWQSAGDQTAGAWVSTAPFCRG